MRQSCPDGNAKGIYLLLTAVPLIETHADLLHRPVRQLHTVLRRFYRRTAHICAAFRYANNSFLFIINQSLRQHIFECFYKDFI